MNQKIHYDDFIEQIVLESGYDYDTVKDYVGVMFETIVTQSTKGESVKIRNFGSFQPRWYKAKRGINPQTKQPLDILPHYHIHFASSKALENALNSKPSKPIFVKLILLSLAVLLASLLVYFNISINETNSIKTIKPIQELQSSLQISDESTKPIKTIIEKIAEPQIVKEEVNQVIQDPIIVSQKSTPIIQPKNVPLYSASHTITANESLSVIGLKVYGNKGFWPLLYSANNSKVLNPDLIFTGYSLVIPEKTASKTLYISYMDVYNAYMQRGLIGESYWILCEGSKFIGEDFKIYLKKKLTQKKYKIIEKCSSK